MTQPIRKFEWRTQHNRIGPSSERYFVNEIRIGFVVLAVTERGKPTQYNWRMTLPGFTEKTSSGTAPTEALAKEHCERAVIAWFKYADGVTQ